MNIISDHDGSIPDSSLSPIDYGRSFPAGRRVVMDGLSTRRRRLPSTPVYFFGTFDRSFHIMGACKVPPRPHHVVDLAWDMEDMLHESGPQRGSVQQHLMSHTNPDHDDLPV